MNAPRKLSEPFSLDSKFTLDEGPIYLNGARVRLMSLADKLGLPWLPAEAFSAPQAEPVLQR